MNAQNAPIGAHPPKSSVQLSTGSNGATGDPKKGEVKMHAERMEINTNAVIPFMAALPYAITADEPDETGIQYDPGTQRTIYAGRNFSTCRYEESVNPLFGKSRSDTQKDD